MSPPPASCELPSLKAADLATSVVTEPPPEHHDVPDPNIGVPTNTDPLPILPVENADPAYPTAFMSCGDADPYNRKGFYQFGSTFSRNDGLDAVAKFCDEQIERKT
ncbi:MAG: hypothetical protein Q9164_007793, partial [Protoblastenia rupestris]